MSVFGAMLIMFSGCVAAYLLTREENSRLESARGLVELLEYIKSSVENYAMPCALIIKKCPEDIFKRCGICAGEARGDDFADLSRKIKTEDSECRRIFLEFASEFGKNNRQEEVQRCAYYASAMRSRREAILSESKGRKRIRMILPVAGALAVIVLLL